MAYKIKTKKQTPELPISLDEKLFKGLDVSDLFCLIRWIEKRQDQVLKATQKKLEKEKQSLIKKQEKLDVEATNLATTRVAIESQLSSQYGSVNENVDNVLKKLSDATSKIKIYTEKKIKLQVALKKFQENNTELFSVRDELNKIEKKQQNLHNLKMSYKEQIEQVENKKNKLTKQANENN